MISLACILVLNIYGKPEFVAMTGTVVGETNTRYTIDFSNAAQTIDGLKGDYSKYIVHKDYPHCDKVEQ